MAVLDSVVKAVANAVKDSVSSKVNSTSSSSSKTNSSSGGGTYKVGSDGKAPSGLSVGDSVVTGGGTYKITGVNSDGTYKSELSNANQTTSNYTGSYSNRTPGDWIGGETRDRGTPTDYGTYQDDLNRLTEAQKNAQKEALKKAKQQALANLDVQEQAIKPMYQNQRNMASASSQQGARSFAEYLANRGLTNSGASAQGEINRLGALQNTMGNIGVAEANAYRDIANQRTAVENDYVSSLANANAQIDANYYNSLLNYNQAQREKVEALKEQALGRYSADYYQEYLNYINNGGDPNDMYALNLLARSGQKAESFTNSKMNNALNLIASGMIDYNTAMSAGMTVEQAQEYYNTLQAQAKAQAEAEAQQRELENYIALQKLQNDTAQTNYNISKPYYKPSSGGSSGSSKLSASQLNTIISNVNEYITDAETEEEGKTNARNYIKMLNTTGAMDNDTAQYFVDTYGLRADTKTNNFVDGLKKLFK